MPPGVFINEDPPEHTMHRALVSRAFTPGRMRKLEQQIRAFCEACLDPLREDDHFDFVLDLGAQMPVKAIGMLLGIPEADQPSVRDAAVRKLRNEPGEPLRVTKERYFSGKAYAEYVAWRAAHPSDDLVTELLNVEFEDLGGERRKLSQDELLTFIAVIAGAGVETTGRLFGWMGKVLAEHPDQRAEVAKDRSLVANTVEELLRYEPPGPHVARYVAEDVELHGRVVPAGSALLLMVSAANRDERRFDDPDRFDIHRTIGQSLTFGYGAHYCLGAALARIEGRIALDEVLDRWPEWEIDLAAARRAPTSTVRGWDSMPAVVG
jgi:cytochrome P450